MTTSVIGLWFYALAVPNVLTGTERTQHVLTACNEYNIIIYLNLMSSGTEDEEEVGLIFTSTYDLCVVLCRVPARVCACELCRLPLCVCVCVFVVCILACAHIDYVKS